MADRFRKMATLIMLVSVWGIVLSACGVGTATSSTAPAARTGTTVSTAAAASSGTTTNSAGSTGVTASGAACPNSTRGQTITMWSPLTGPDGNVMTSLAQKFSQDNPQGIKVSHVVQPDYLQKLSTAAAGKSLPEMTVIRASDVSQMVRTHVLQPISNDMLNIAGGVIALKGQFLEAVWNAGEINGQHYTVPLDIHPLILYYNKDMFQKAGLTMPTDRPMTKEEFEKAVDTLNKDGITGVIIGTAFETSALFQSLIRQFGGDIVNADGTQATYNSPQGVQAATYIRDLKAKTTPRSSGAGEPMVKLFQQQKGAMIFEGPWHIASLSKEPFVGYAQIPQIGDTYAVWAGSHQLSLTTANPAKQAAAACWMSWLSQNSVQWAKAGQVPARKLARESVDLKTVAPQVAQFYKTVEAIKLVPPVPGLFDALVAQGFEPALNAYLLGQSQDIKKGLDDAAAKSNQIIEQNAQKYK